jgi:hypothetical protein
MVPPKRREGEKLAASAHKGACAHSGQLITRNIFSKRDVAAFAACRSVAAHFANVR